MNILSAIKSFEKKHINLTIFIGIAIGVGVGMYLYGWLVPVQSSTDMNHGYGKKIKMYSMVREHTMSRDGALDGVVVTMDHGPMMSTVVSEKQFLESMIIHHEAAVRMSHQVLGLQGISAATKKLATEIIDAQNAEIEMMQEWLTAKAKTQ